MFENNIIKETPVEYVQKRDTKNIRCNRCHKPVLKSDVEGYQYQCMFCDEDLVSFETYIGELHTDVELQELYKQTKLFLK